MKTCFVCKQEKPLEDFPLRSTSVDGRLYKCRACKQKYDRAHYAKNRDHIGPKKTARAIVNRERSLTWLHQYLLAHPCVDCGETDIVVLEFDHLRDKVYEVTTMAQGGFPISTIEKEIAKCEVRCANDHRRVTFKRANSRRWQAAQAQRDEV